MKITVSLSKEVADRLASSAREQAGKNASAVVEVALRQLFELPTAEMASLLTRFRMDRKATTRSGWARAFWYVLGQSMNQEDYLENVYAARKFGGFYVALLFTQVGRPDDENDPFHPYVGPLPIMPDSPAPREFSFLRSESPVTAAEKVAETLREFGAHIQLVSPEMGERR
jgi:hypothetical protein